jgi:hypothetical protein
MLRVGDTIPLFKVPAGATNFRWVFEAGDENLLKRHLKYDLDGKTTDVWIDLTKLDGENSVGVVTVELAPEFSMTLGYPDGTAKPPARLHAAVTFR